MLLGGGTVLCSEVIPMMEAREARVNKLSTHDQCNVMLLCSLGLL